MRSHSKMDITHRLGGFQAKWTAVDAVTVPLPGRRLAITYPSM